jgi:hypothetical protein
VEVSALADAGALTLWLPEHFATRSELARECEREVTLADGRSMRAPCVGPVKIEFETRIRRAGALVMGDEVLLGVVPMEDMDLLLSPTERRITVKPQGPTVPHARVKQAHGTCQRGVETPSPVAVSRRRTTHNC